MASRPNFIDLDNRRAASPSLRDLPSPRSGEIPPALSPLDAFALQSRLLAQQLEASRNNGRRVSRLPPLTIANELAKPRPGYFTAPPSAGPARDNAPSPKSAGPDQPGTSPEVARPTERPVSRYPFISTFNDAESIYTRDTMATIKQVPDEDREEPEPAGNTSLHPSTADSSSFHLAPSAAAIPGAFPTVQEEDESEAEPTFYDASQGDSSSHTSLNVLASEPPRPPNLRGLVVPPSPLHPRSPTSFRNDQGIQYARSDTGNDSDSLSIPGDRIEARHFDRKPSNSSVFGRPHSPFSPLFAPPRSPSIASERSGQPRASVNFSRPMSRAGRPERRPSLESATRSPILDSPPQRPSVDVTSVNESALDSPRQPPAPWVEGAAPLSPTDDESSFLANHPNGVPSYVYAKYSLPRGRILSRNSVMLHDFATHKFEWEQPRATESNVTPIKENEEVASGAQERSQRPGDFRSSSLVMSTVPNFTQPERSYSADDSTAAGKAALKAHKSNPSFPPKSPSTLTTHSEGSIGEDNVVRSPPGSLRRPVTQPKSSLTQNRFPNHSQQSFPSESLQQLPPEAHLALGIELHEAGQLQKSTYHLRLAARGGDVTAMLLYALACRHGWGMRASQEEGVNWLRKAVESAGMEVADDEDDDLSVEGQSDSNGQPSDVAAKKAHKAQLALSIYELGVSYMNGWGIGQDKPLGLRCFEIAGSWGDGDALAEAGFCYAKGVGCKKDLKKAAEMYRKAEKRGVEMAGNSWIYKEKYMPSSGGQVEQPQQQQSQQQQQRKGRGAEEEKEKDKEKEKKPRNKSRTRSLFGGRKKHQQQTQQPLPPQPSAAP